MISRTISAPMTQVNLQPASSSKRHILDPCAADAEARAVQVEIRDLEIVPPRTAVEKIEPRIPDRARRTHIGELG